MAGAVVESFVLPGLAGGSFSLIAVAYRLGLPRGVTPIQMLGVAAVAGAIVFGGLFGGTGMQMHNVPLSVWMWGILGGLGQYAAVRLFTTALRLGPLSPLWCVVSLAFIPTLAYSGVFLSETLRPLQYLAMITSVLCVIVASLSTGRDETSGSSPDAKPAKAQRNTLLYLAVLATVFITNSLLAIGQRNLGAMRGACDAAAFRSYGHFLLVLAYLVLAIGVGVDLGLSRRSHGPWKAPILLGLLLAVGSMGGLALLNACSSSAIVFAVAGITQILIVAVISVAIFGERTTLSWYGTIILGVLSVVLANPGMSAARP